MKTEILILDYNRQDELKLLLESLKENAKFDKDIVVLNNGGERYADAYKEQGLCDRVIHFDRGVGCGFGTIHLFAQCRTKYAFYVQVDHYLAYELNNNDIKDFVSLIEESGFFYVDVAGDQGHGNYSERAQFIKVEDYNRISKQGGGPGCWNHLKWTEECVQNYIKENELKYHSFYQSAWLGDKMVKLPPFIDNGKWSIRENPDGAIFKHRTDLKTVYCLNKPTQVYDYPPFSHAQWNIAINGDYPKEGMVPEGWRDSVFEFWK